ncbi:Uncharacterized [Moorella glycerini]|uniref:Uncharacterized protein n=1 Tax=Neomoorella stamsii TaxID=1266720 RepID=A0A9X7P784_9FIRM|nr:MULTISPECIES: hypothetical protein [Moorella]PRR76361.1 hypothetical protein MOST_05280 [Moorella stamsii]CEP67070.1 Uncharacterized [Moorella glycerini]
MTCRDKLVNQEVLEALLDDYLRRKNLPATYKNYLLRLIEGQVNILVHNLLQEIEDERRGLITVADGEIIQPDR